MNEAQNQILGKASRAEQAEEVREGKEEEKDRKRRREKEKEEEEKKPVPCTAAPLCQVYRPAAGEARRRRRFF